MRPLVPLALVLCSTIVACGPGGLTGQGGVIDAWLHPPSAAPLASPVSGTVATLAPSPGPNTFALQASNGYLGGITFNANAIPSGVSVVVLASVPGAPAPQSVARTGSNAPAALATWQLGFSGWSGTASGSFSGFPTVTLAMLSASNAVVEIFDSSESGAAPAVLSPQPATNNGFVTFALANGGALPSYFLFDHVYWIELVAGSSLATPGASAT